MNLRFWKKKPVPRRRGYNAAKVTRLTNDWATSSSSINADLSVSLSALRSRSRDLANNNEYAKRFFGLLRNNVIGANPITLQMRVMEKDGRADVDANKEIEADFKSFSKIGNFDVTGKLSRADFERLFIETVARDGEALIRKVPGYDNPHGYALQFLDAEHLDDKLNVDKLGNGNRIVMGVELNGWGKPVAYHLIKNHPGEAYIYSRDKHDRVDASQIIHAFIASRPEQVRGVPWLHAAMIALKDLGGYREAAIVAARVGASKMGFFSSEGDGQYQGDDTDDDGNQITEVEAGTLEDIGNRTFQAFDPTYPHDQFDAFNSAMLKGIAGSTGISYYKFANDHNGLNYSSGRLSELDEREFYMTIQDWIIGILNDCYFSDYLGRRIMGGGINLPHGKLDKFDAATWQPRRWQWVDPAKQAAGNEKDINNMIKSPQQIIRESGRDPEEVLDEIKAWQEMIVTKEIGSGKSGSGDVAGGSDIGDEMEAYTKAVRAGRITPQMIDEESIRKTLKLPQLSKEARELWSKQDNVRQPITLKQASEAVEDADGVDNDTGNDGAEDAPPPEM